MLCRGCSLLEGPLDQLRYLPKPPHTAIPFVSPVRRRRRLDRLPGRVGGSLRRRGRILRNSQ